jgi:hypothetical protein
MEGGAAGRLRETEFLGEVRRGAVIIDNHFTDLPKITVEQALKELENHSKVEDPTHNQHPSSQETLLPSQTLRKQVLQGYRDGVRSTTGHC